VEMFDNSYVESIIKLDNIKDDKFKVRLSTGLEEEVKLTKAQVILVKTHLYKSQGIPCKTNAAEEYNEASDSRNNSGLKPAKAITERRVGTKTWAPTSMLHIKGKKRGMVYRFVNTDIPGNVNKKLSEQWEVCTEEGVGTVSKTIHDGGPLGSTNRVRELILMRMPESVRDERRAYFSNQELDSRGIAESLDSATEGNAYGKVDDGHSVVKMK